MTTRRLAAILAADVVGFSSMMEKDEEGTLKRVKALQREVIEPKVKERGGRLVKTTGDGFLCEFGSPVEAVRCALEVQEATRASGEVEQSLLLRMGINLGDIIIEQDGDVYGEGVNVAARLEQLAEPGGICISGKVHDEVEGKVPVAFESRGEKQVKNIARPVRVYALARGTRHQAHSRPLPLPDKPSIAVLPFTNMSGDPEQEYFADGVVEDIITGLSHFRGLFVIARNSSFTYKGRAVDIKQIGQELGVRYVLEGSIRRVGSRLRVTGQLIDSQTGKHVWADKIEGGVDELFEVQDRITEKVVGAIPGSLWEAEGERLRRRPTESLSAYELYLRAVPLVHRVTREGCNEAIELLIKATGIDPHFAVAYALAAQCHVLRIFQGWSDDLEAEKAAITGLSTAALTWGNEDAEVLWRTGHAISIAGHGLDQCLAMLDRALELNPKSAHAWRSCGWLKVYSGMYMEASRCFERARRLSPRDTRSFGMAAGLAASSLFQMRYEDAIKHAREALAQNPRFTSSWRYLIAALAHADRLPEAKEAVRQLKSLDPQASLRSVQGAILSTPDIAVYVDGLRKAGIPD